MGILRQKGYAICNICIVGSWIVRKENRSIGYTYNIRNWDIFKAWIWCTGQEESGRIWCMKKDDKNETRRTMVVEAGGLNE